MPPESRTKLAYSPQTPEERPVAAYYRLIVAFAYRMQLAYIKFVGTHAQYDQVDAATVDQSQPKE